MGVLYKDQNFIIGLTLIRKRTYVTDRATGRTVYPSSKLIQKLGVYAAEMTIARMTEDERIFVGSYMMTRFATSAFNPDSLPASMFLTGDPEKAIASALMTMRGELPSF